MIRATITALWFVSLPALVYTAEPEARFARTLHIPGSWELVVVAEGDFEPRSIGSYALRIYGGASTHAPLGDFLVGVIRPRNGVVEAVFFESIAAHDTLDIIVTVRSAGSGGYLSADAFQYRRGSLELLASVAGLEKRADPIAALRDKLAGNQKTAVK